MTTFEPAKRKYHPGANRRFQAALFIWIALSILFALYPLLWITPPYEKLTPYLYFVAAVLWIPFGVRHARHYSVPLLSMGLIAAGCAFTALVLTWYPKPHDVPPEFVQTAPLQFWGYLTISLTCLILALAWIPFAVRHLRSYHVPWLTLIFVFGAVIGTGLFLTVWHEVESILGYNLVFSADPAGGSLIIHYTGGWTNNCIAYGVELISLNHLPLSILTTMWRFDCMMLF